MFLALGYREGGAEKDELPLQILIKPKLVC